MAQFSRHFYFNLRRDHQKISFERRDYESVDEKSLSLAMPRKTMKKKNSGGKGLMLICFLICALCWMQLFSKWHMWRLCFYLHYYKAYVLAMQLLYVKLTLFKKELFSKRGDVPTLIL